MKSLDKREKMSQVVATVLIVVIVLIFLMVSLFLSTFVVREKEVVIIERFGRFHSQLTAGVHFVIPWVDWPRVSVHAQPNLIASEGTGLTSTF